MTLIKQEKILHSDYHKLTEQKLNMSQTLFTTSYTTRPMMMPYDKF